MDDRFTVGIIRGVVSALAYLGRWAIRGGERVIGWVQSRSASTPARVVPVYSHSATSGGVPAVLMAVEGGLGAVAVPAAGAAAVEEPVHDDLDWAAGLSHATVASLHVGCVLSMVKAGWLIPAPGHLSEVGAALDAMEAFRERTAAAVAPVLGVLSDEERIDFFSDFEKDFPPDLPELDAL